MEREEPAGVEIWHTLDVDPVPQQRVREQRLRQENWLAAWHLDSGGFVQLSDQLTETATIVGPICETGDRLGTDRLLPPSSEGDVMLIANAGAYGYVMSSQYNRREVAPEVVI